MVGSTVVRLFAPKSNPSRKPRLVPSQREAFEPKGQGKKRRRQYFEIDRIHDASIEYLRTTSHPLSYVSPTIFP